jgi:hypothetical protein
MGIVLDLRLANSLLLIGCLLFTAAEVSVLELT